MLVSLIAAVADNGVIGKDNAIPWDLPRERRHYRDVTMGHPVIMGRRTFESIGRPLPGRTMIILTRQRDYRPEGCIVVHSLEAALAAAGNADEVFISGGAEVYAEAMPHVGRIYLTSIHAAYEGDAFFPPLPPGFHTVSTTKVDDVIPYDVVVLERSAFIGAATEK